MVSAGSFITDHKLIDINGFRGSERWLDIFIEQETKQCLELLRSDGFSIYVAGFDEGAYTPKTVPVDKPIALVMGTELSGVSDIARDLSDGTVMIPMSGFTQSFNVSITSRLFAVSNY